MRKRYVVIWFRYLKTDWIALRRPQLASIPFVLVLPVHGKMVVTAANQHAELQGIYAGMALADARAIFPLLKNMDDEPSPSGKLLLSIARYCIRFAPIVALDAPDGIVLDATGCAHLFGGEEKFITVIHDRFKKRGYDVRLTMADTIGGAWAMSHFGNEKIIGAAIDHVSFLQLPPIALRLEDDVAAMLSRLGIKDVNGLINIPRKSLSRRFGKQLLLRIDQAFGNEAEYIVPVQEPAQYEERLPCLEPIITAMGIQIGLEQLLEQLCKRLQAEGKGLRNAVFKCFRVDGELREIAIGTGKASHNKKHIFQLFSLKLESIEPALGIELFVLQAQKVENAGPVQESIWKGSCRINDNRLSELMDRIANKIGAANIERYLPAEHHWPERSFQPAASLHEDSKLSWQDHIHRPIIVLPDPAPIEVTAPIPDYPPMNFRYKNKLHIIKKADGPERIEQEWWLQQGEHRDYYAVEDEEGKRYWLFRYGHYTGDKRNQWFLHGFFS